MAIEQKERELDLERKQWGMEMKIKAMHVETMAS